MSLSIKRKPLQKNGVLGFQPSRAVFTKDEGEKMGLMESIVIFKLPEAWHPKDSTSNCIELSL
jgi:hypothetical protein